MAVFSSHFKLSFKNHRLVGIFISLLLSVAALTALLLFVYQNKIYQGIYVDDIHLGGAGKSEALEKLETQAFTQPQGELLLTAAPSSDNLLQATHSSSINLSTIITQKNYQASIDQAYQIGRSGGFISKLKALIGIYDQPAQLNSAYQVNHEVLRQELDSLKSKLDQAPTPPSAILTNSGQAQSLQVDPGKDGQILDIDKNLKLITYQILSKVEETGSPQSVRAKLQLTILEKELAQDQIKQFKNRAQQFISKELIFSSHPIDPEEKLIQLDRQPTISFTLNDQDLISFLKLPEGLDHQLIQQTVEQWAQQADQKPINAEFEYNPNTLEVKKFKPPQTGKQINQAKVAGAIKSYLNQVENGEKLKQTLVKQLPLEEAQPEITLAKTNNLGINQLIGFGDSHYDHSIPSRIHNVKITADKLSLTIVPPGEKFSFNQTIGEVSRSTGYQPAYIIKDGRTMLGDGGGVCQVSTTTFRALLDAGVDITRRLPHSYRVSYYELDKKPGFDATVYSGNIDLRFVNDTPGHLLIYSQANSEELYMKVEIYGTDDGRTTEIKNYRQWGYQPAPPPQYIPDDSLAPGQLKQVDWAASGIKAEFDWIVKDKNGNIIREKTYYSNYRPWAAKYLRGV